MAKKKFQREVDEVERLQNENRDLKATNRALLKRLKKVDKEYALEIEKANTERAREESYSEQPENRSQSCVSCGKGNRVIVDLLGRKFEKCTVCDYRSGKKI